MSFNFSSFVDDLVPDHINTDYPELVEFIKVYALYLEKENMSGSYLNQVDQQRDIDLIEESLLNELQNEIGTPIPRTFEADPRLFYKHLVEFYRSRGTPESIKSFFKLIYNEEVEISFPKDEMFIPSDGKWQDHRDGILADPSLYTPTYTWTIATASNTIEDIDDEGFKPTINDDLVYVNGVYQQPDTYTITNFLHVDDYWMSSIVFDNELQVGDVVKVYRRGMFSDIDGFVSNYRYIQDSYFYQKFSYVLKTGGNISKWKSAFTRLIHPAGFIFFGEILIFVEILNAGSPSTQPGYQERGLPFTINVSTVTMGMGAHEVGTFVEKSYTPETNYLTVLGPADHFDNTKFINTRPMSDYSEITFEDVINKNITQRYGAEIEITTI